jgi:hypothetical protein
MFYQMTRLLLSCSKPPVYPDSIDPSIIIKYGDRGHPMSSSEAKAKKSEAEKRQKQAQRQHRQAGAANLYHGMVTQALERLTRWAFPDIQVERQGVGKWQLWNAYTRSENWKTFGRAISSHPAN